ncbi:lantibiotic dehydratase [Streptomyces cadmiisoli]|uniref:lantibiotic dehydratase n=1 Tax=Streptomyces cadmiisoli TaxID=2184053 RepID=UPI0036669557
MHHQHRFSVSPEFTVRVAGLTADTMGVFGARRAGAALEEYAQLTSRTVVLADALGELLYQVIHDLADTPAKPLAVALRRAVHAGDVAKADQLVGRLGERLPRPACDEIRSWADLSRRCAVRRGELDDLLAAEAGEEIRRLRSAVAHPVFRRGLAHASPTVHRALGRWLLVPGDVVPSRKLAVSLARYVSRAAAKTSPYSLFTHIGLASFSGGREPLTLAQDNHLVGSAELALWPLGAIARLLMDRPANRDPLPVKVNPSACVHGQTLLVVGRGLRQESVLSMPLTPALERCLQLADDGMTLAELRVQLGELGGRNADRARTDAYVDRLVSTGILQTPTPVTDQSPHHLEALRAWARQMPDVTEETRESLDAVCVSLAAYPRDTVPETQAERRADVYRALSSLADSLGVDQVPLPRTDAFFHNVLSPAPIASAGAEAWGPVFEELDVVRRFFAAFDMGLASRLAVQSYIVERYPADQSIPFVVLCHDLFEEAAQNSEEASEDPRGQRLRALAAHAFALLADPAPTGLSDSPAEAVRELGRLRLSAQEAIAGLGTGPDGTVRIDPEWLAELAGTWEHAFRLPRSVSVYGQPFQVDGKPHLVANMLTTGWGRAANRVRRQMADAGVTVPAKTSVDRSAEGAVPVEVRGAFGNNGNVRHSATAYTVDYPDTVADRPASELIPLGDLQLRHHGTVRSVTLSSKQLGFDVLPLHLGLMAPTLLPPAMRLLLAFGESSVIAYGKQNLLAFPTQATAEPHGVRLPRLSLPHVTVQRACWLFTASDIPRPRPDDGPAAHPLRIRQWRIRHGVPERTFARVLSSRPSTNRANVMQKERKPGYLDFSSPVLMASFERMLADSDDRDLVVLEECLPDPSELAKSDGGPGRVTEVVLEITATDDDGPRTAGGERR